MTNPAPMTPPDCDVSMLSGFMLNVEKLMASELVAVSSGDEFKAAVSLWCRAWKQVPAASLPNDEKVLAAFSGAGAKWRKVRDMALRGFVLCSDGRLYHPVLAADAIRAAKAREQRKKAIDARYSKAANAAGAGPRPGAPPNDGTDAGEHTGEPPPVPTGTPTAVGTDVPSPVLPVQGRDGTEERKKERVPKATPSADPPLQLAIVEPGRPIDLKAEIWSRGVAFLRRHGIADDRARPLIGRWRRDHGDGHVLDALARAEAECASDAVPFIEACLRGKSRHDRTQRGEAERSARDDLHAGIAAAALRRMEPGDR